MSASTPGRFELLGKLGEGGVGVVYEAHDRERNMRVALKRLRRLNPSDLYRFKREFRSLADLSHPNIVTLYELLSEGDDWFLTMELVEGSDFVTYVRAPSAVLHDADTAGTVDLEATAATQELSLTPPTAEAPLAPARIRRKHDRPRAQPVDEADQRPKLPSVLPPVEAVVELDRLRHAAARLAQALQALHDADLVHRDLKPSNVRVTDAGRVVLMDFGIVADARPHAHAQLEASPIGTPGYMAPEQAAGDPPSAAADWYAFGVMLYVALTGRRPFEGHAPDLLVAQQGVDPHPPGAFVTGIPPKLEQLCIGLLSRHPADRPRGHQVLESLGFRSAATPATVDTSLTGLGGFVGRAHELHALHGALDAARRGESACVFVCGESGMGKSTLMRRFLVEADAVDESEAPLVLTGRCHERESVPYKAWDAIVDGLSVWLRNMPEDLVEQVRPDDVDLLARLFPVLRRAPGLAAESGNTVVAPHEQRARAAAALRTLLGSIAARRCLVLCIDDLQWADNDSIDLLLDVFRAPPEHLLIIASVRTGAMPEGVTPTERLAELTAALSARMAYRELTLGPLSREDQRELLGRLPGAASAGARAEDLWRESAGNPLLLTELARYLSELGDSPPPPVLRLTEVLAHRLDQLAEPARLLLDAVAVAGEPAPMWLLAEATGLTDDERERATAVLRISHLARIARPGHEPWLDAYHSRVREAVLAHLTAEQRRALHGQLAVAHEGWDRATVDSLARHWLAAGDYIRAIDYLKSAASIAREKLAFDRAAALYRKALEIAPADEHFELLRALGDSLALAGRSYEAAHIYDQAAELARDNDVALDLARAAADNAMRSGHIAEALERMSWVTAQLGVPFGRTRGRALLALVLDRLRLAARGGLRYKPRPASEIPARELSRLDALFSMSGCLGMVDPIRASALQTRHLLAALACGEEQRVCRALSAEVAYLGAQGRFTSARCRRLTARVKELVGRLDDPYHEAQAALALGMATILDGDVRGAERSFRTADRILTRKVAGADWERVTARYFLCIAQINSGRLAAMSETVRRGIEDAERRNDAYARNLFMSHPNTWRMIREDRVDDARRGLDSALEGWAEKPYYQAHFFVDSARVILDLYRGDAEAALSTLTRVNPIMRSLMLHRVPWVRAEMLNYRARAALALGDGRTAVSIARSIEKLGRPAAVAIGAYLRAPVALWDGDSDRAVALLQTAIEGFDADGIAHMVEVCGYRLAVIRDGPDAAPDLPWLREQGVVDLRRMLDLLTPGYARGV